MGQHLVQGRGGGGLGGAGQPGPERLGRVQPSLGDQLADGQAGEGLGDGTDLGRRVGGEGDAGLAVGQAVAGAQHHLALHLDHHRAAEAALGGRLGQVAVDGPGQFALHDFGLARRLGGGGRGGQRGGGEQQAQVSHAGPSQAVSLAAPLWREHGDLTPARSRRKDGR